MRSPLAVALFLTLALVSFAAPAEAADPFPHHPDTGVPAGDVLVAVIDTGITPTHPEFGGYRGQAGVPDPQIVAWYDFGLNGVPASGVTWDPTTPVPWDSGHAGSHGTGTASLVGGATVGAFPGVKLAIAKVTNAGGALVNVEAAMEWAVKTVGADVVSMSLGTSLPTPGALSAYDEIIEEGTAAGSLFVISAGNGLFNAGVKYSSITQAPASSKEAIVVGAGSKSGSTTARLVGASFSNTEPDVMSWGAAVVMASPTGYKTSSGTSFSCPLVAGWAAKVMETARQAGQPDDPARVETIVLRTANDDLAVPYSIEGFGWVSNGVLAPFDTLTPALAHATAGTLPAPGPNEPIRTVTDAARGAFNDVEGATLLLATGTSTPGSIGASAPALRDVDAYTITLAAGESLRVDVAYADPGATNDLDLFLYAASGPLLSHNSIRALSTKGSSTNVLESFTYAASVAGTYTITVEGWVVTGPQPYTITMQWQGAGPTFLGDHLGIGGKQA